jgi:hypothetical protein
MPTPDRVGRDHEDRPAVTADDTRERGEDRAIAGFETRTAVVALQHGKLLAQHEDLDIFGAIAPTQHQEVEYKADKTVETSHTLILAATEPRR